MPVLLVTHSPKSIRENGGGKSTPIGGTLFGAKSRINAHVSKAASGTTTITVASNGSEPLTIKASCEIDGDTPRWSLVDDTEEKPARGRGEGTKEKRRQAALALVNAPFRTVASKTAAAKYLAEKGHGSENTIRTNGLRDGGWLDSLVTLGPQGWEWRTPAFSQGV